MRVRMTSLYERRRSGRSVYLERSSAARPCLLLLLLLLLAALVRVGDGAIISSSWRRMRLGRRRERTGKAAGADNHVSSLSSVRAPEADHPGALLAAGQKVQIVEPSPPVVLAPVVVRFADQQVGLFQEAPTSAAYSTEGSGATGGGAKESPRKGLFLLLHACQSVADDWFWLPEESKMTKQLLQRGYSVLALQSASGSCWEAENSGECVDDRDDTGTVHSN